MKKNTPVLLFFLLFLTTTTAQDAFFTHFFNNRSYYNPAMTGIGGAFSINAQHKSQWKASDVPAFVSTAITIEETVLCHFLDYGFFLNYDREGAGVFETIEPGFRLAAALPLGEFSNLRIGGTVLWGWKRIDYTQLIFSDQLDPRYGFRGQATAFIPPNDGVSQRYLSPAVGIAFRKIYNAEGRNIVNLDAGVALHNGLSLGRDNFGHTESILGLDARIPIRWNAFADISLFHTSPGGRSFWSINPQVLYQEQAEINYLEAGLRLGFNRQASIGFFYHSSQTSLENATDADWFSFNAEVGLFPEVGNRIDLGFSWSTNIEGLRNLVGPIYEVSVTYHLQASPACRIATGRDPSTRGTFNCPPYERSPNRKIYDGIWYKHNTIF
jgi:type IX secretion system PorP/SprF family membrane protein